MNKNETNFQPIELEVNLSLSPRIELTWNVVLRLKKKLLAAFDKQTTDVICQIVICRCRQHRCTCIALPFHIFYDYIVIYTVQQIFCVQFKILRCISDFAKL